MGTDMKDYSGLKRSIVMLLLYRKGTRYYFLGGAYTDFYGFISRDLDRSLSSKTVKWIFFLDLDRFFS